MKNSKFYLGAVAFTISSAMIPLMSIFPRGKNLAMATILAVVFWVMLIMGIVATICFGKSVRSLTKKKLRVLIPFQTKGTKIVDSLFIISFVATFVVLLGKVNANWLQIALLFADIYLLELHFLLSLTVGGLNNRRKKENDEN